VTERCLACAGIALGIVALVMADPLGLAADGTPEDVARAPGSGWPST